MLQQPLLLGNPHGLALQAGSWDTLCVHEQAESEHQRPSRAHQHSQCESRALSSAEQMHPYAQQLWPALCRARLLLPAAEQCAQLGSTLSEGPHK